MDVAKSSVSRDRVSKKRKSVACQRCHQHKIKCNEERPCKNCKAVEGVTCIYPVKDRKTTVQESYINGLLNEIDQLKRQKSEPTSICNSDQDVHEESAVEDITKDSGNPLVGDAWFVPLDESPVFIGEAACTAFSSRLRQLLLHTQAETHIPRTHYIQDAQLDAASEYSADWPSRPQAHLLVESVIATVGQCYNLPSLSSARISLERAYTNLASLSQVIACKLFALFALAEVYNPRLADIRDMSLPGLSYFAKARSMFSVIPERATVDHIEVLIIFTLYSLAMNRRHSANYYIGSAMRLSLTLGLHHNITESQLPDLAARQARVRIFWTVYILDRSLASKIGHPNSVQDDDIEVDQPSDVGLSDTEKNDLVRGDYLCANMRLASIAGDTIGSLYSRRKSEKPFTQKVQAIFKSLRDWSASIPEKIKLHSDKSVSWNVVSLHLCFNQCVILATRPTLLHVFHVTNRTGRKDEIPQATFMLAETCVHTARHSCRLLTQAWIEGTLPALDYSSSQYLFAAATILAFSNLTLRPDASTDNDIFQSAHHLLRQLERQGNIAAREHCQHIDLMLECIAKFETGKVQKTTSTTTAASLPPKGGVLDTNLRFDLSGLDEMTTEMAIFQPNVQDFLSCGNADLDAVYPFDTTTIDLWPYTSMPDFPSP